MTWNQRLRAANVGHSWLRPKHLKNHEQNRHLNEGNLDKIGKEISDDTGRRQANPISVVVRGNWSPFTLSELWDPPEGLELVVIGGWHRVCALKRWLEDNSIRDEGFLGRWYAIVYSQGNGPPFL